MVYCLRYHVLIVFLMILESYNKGLKRLEKSFTSVVISSTDSEDQENHIQSEMDHSSIISADDVMRELEDIPILDDGKNIAITLWCYCIIIIIMNVNPLAATNEKTSTPRKC